MSDNPFIDIALAQATPEEAQKIAASLRAKKDTAPGAQAATNLLPQASLDQLTSRFDATRIPISKLEQMSFDPTVSFALFFIKAQILRARWGIKCSDPQVGAFIDRALREIYPSYISQRLMALVYGYQASVKRFETRPGLDWTYSDPLDETNPDKLIWEEGSIDPLVLKPIQMLPPKTVEPLWTPDGEFNGIKYKPVQSSASNQAGEFDVLHSLWSTNDKEKVNGSLWGYPRIGPAYRFWWSFWFDWGLADRHFEKDADPPAIVYYPSGKPDIDGKSMRDYALMIGDSARSNSTVALPSDPVVADDGTTKNLREWELTFAKDGGNFEVFAARFDQVRTMMLQAMMVPDQAFEAKGGTAGYNSTGQQMDAFQLSQIVLMGDIDWEINRYVIPQLVAANFPDKQVTATKVTKGFDTQDLELTKLIIQGMANSDASQLNLDVPEMLDEVGLPRMSPAAIAKANAEAAAAAQQSAPPEQPAIPGEQAGVNKQGLYYAPRELITLSSPATSFEDDSQATFMAELAAVAALRDPMVLADAQRLRTIWRTSLEQDLSVASNLLHDYKGDLNLDEDYFQRFYRRAKGRAHETAVQTRRALMGIMRRASTAEVEKAGLTDFSWDPLNSDRASAFLSERATKMADGITATTRDQVKTYLAELVKQKTPPEQMGQLLNAHFRMMSSWRSDMIVRSEIGKAYNMATLLAAQDAGIKQVQAIDAQLGPDRSDPHCIARNGKVFSIEQAFLELEDEHPNGTLQFRILRKPVKVKRLPVPDNAPTPLLASYEETEDSILVTLSEAFTEPQANAYLLTVLDGIELQSQISDLEAA